MRSRTPRPPGRRLRTFTVSTCAVTAVIAPITGGCVTASAQTTQVSCDRGTFCLWAGQGYSGALHLWDLRNANPGDCIPMPAGFAGRSLANRSDRSLSVYSDAGCDKNEPYNVYPGGGTFAPEAPVHIAAIRIGD